MKTKYLAFFSALLLQINILSAQTSYEAYGGCDSCCDWDITVEADWLYWKPFQSNLDITLPFPSTIPHCVLGSNDPELIGEGHVRFMEYDWDSGFRIAISKNLCRDDWRLKAVWTHWKGEAHKTASLFDPSLALAPLLYQPAQTFETFAERAKGHLDLTYNVVDLLLGRALCMSRTLVFTPSIGVRYVNIHQKTHVEYSGGAFDTPSGPCFINIPDLAKAKIDWTSSVHAVGIHAGFDTSYQLCGGFSLVGGFGASLLAANTDQHQKQILRETLTARQPEPRTKDNLVDLKEDEWIGLPGLDLFLGIRYERCVCCDRAVVSAQVGWEFNQWWELPRFRRWVDDRKPYLSTLSVGDSLLLQGLTVRAGVSF